MQLLRARIKNFRSLRDVSIEFEAHTALIGGNGAGKSSILKALEKFYSTNKALDQDDYFGRDTTLPVEIELTFGELSAVEQETFESRVRDGTLTVSRVFDGTASSGRYYGSTLQNTDFSAIRAISAATEKRTAYKALKEGNAAYAELPSVANAGQIEGCLQEWELAHPDSLVLLRDDGQFFGFQNAGRGALQRHTSFVFVPAVREASVDAADGKSSAIGRLLEIVVRSAILQRKDVQAFQEEVTTRYRALVAPTNMPELGELANRLTGDLKSLYRDAAVGLTWRDVADIAVPLPAADVSLSDEGFGGPVDRQGHGLQRAFVFTLLQHLAKNSHQTSATEGETTEEAAQATPPAAPSLILAIEEPELYQHPTKQRHLATVLRGLSTGSLPGATGPTQIIFGSHSPMFVAMERANEVRLARRSKSADSKFKHAHLTSLSLANVAKRLEKANNKAPGTWTATTLAPRLHILGTELSEGFFANGVVLVEGRSDRSALQACARLLGLDFHAAGIAILPVEGKLNLDRPYAVFTELEIPTFLVWDCDLYQKEPAANPALLHLADAHAKYDETLSTRVAKNYAYFEDTLESTLILELGKDLHALCLAEACEPFGLTASKDTHKIPEVMHRVLACAKDKGASSPTLEALVNAIWLYLAADEIQL
ncbi:AAA family ATPase [Xanthomonas campestris pv. raphani]|uniref:ATP-dependent nuclease n=1 Tax=Xanthomonas campestris TaxID=339 RepID=UPI002B22D2A5|nr:AAA family ATPase [Xanthomonas campestris]MEA9860472.1 AAA family ATPase [Xanthomonas campestris pv. raphani]MEA9939736.1 AAA family ATPase [Xanthomonas campestris pv. raphani]MEC5194014.1 energy-coupling factor transporter ATP-binding protein EcfA2 [Xanthomonas campestris]